MELKALEAQKKLQTRLEKLQREAKQEEITDLQEELALKAGIAEKETEMAKTYGS